MPAAATDLFRKAAPNWVGAIGSGGVADASVTTVPLVSSTSLPTDTAVDIVIDRVDANGTATPSKMEVVTGVVSSNNLISCIRGVEGTAQAHAAGAIVEVMLTAAMWNDMEDGFLAEHNQDGTHINPFSATTLASVTHAATEKTTPADADELGLIDSAASYVLKKLTWANLKATLLTYFNTVFPAKDGWMPVSDTWAYASATTITVPSGAASLYQKGDKIKITQSAVAYYFYISAVADTVLTVAGEQDVANSAISDIYYSHADSPVGFKKGEDYYRAGVYMSGAQSIATPSLVTVQLNTEVFDTNSNFNTGTYQYTVPVTGYYNVSAYARVESAAAGGYTQFFIYKNGSSFKESIVIQFSSYYFLHITDVVPFTKGDTIDVRCSNNTTTRSLAGGNASLTRFSIQFVGV